MSDRRTGENSSSPSQAEPIEPAPTSANPTTSDPATPEPEPDNPQTPEPEPAAPPTVDEVAAWPIEQQVGQLIMVGVDLAGSDAAARSAITDRHVGNIFLHGRSTAGVAATADLVGGLTSLVSDESTRSLPLYVATDQEGGKVQVLRGPGFSDIPSAMEQAELADTDLEAKAREWGGELADAGVNLNLAPVLDVVPDAATAAKNPPIGAFQRNYGFGLDSTMKGLAFGRGMRAAGVDDVVKHFPGLGLVTANTDVAANVVDTQTSADSDSLRVFGAAIDDGAPFVMMASATYRQLDPDNIAAFSPVVIGDVLRGDLGFDGVVISDDVSAATAVKQWSPGERAVKFVDAGGDMVLASALPSVVPEMVDALVAKANDDPEFATKVAVACHRIVLAKQRLIAG